MPDIPSSDGVPQFKELAEFLDAHKHHGFSFEILPNSFTVSNESGESDEGGEGNKDNSNKFLLVDGNAAAIRKSDLIKAYLAARQILFERPPVENEYKASPSSFSLHLEDAAAARTAAWIALLYDPEHLTAANLRKRQLLASSNKQDASLWVSSSPSPSSSKADDARIELDFNQSLLTSPLHKHSKSPTLWYHRFWLLKQFRPREEQQEVGAALTHNRESPAKQLDEIYDTERSNLWVKEFGIVLQAADQHDKNYHAFHYLRRLHSLLWSDCDCIRSRPSAAVTATAATATPKDVVDTASTAPTTAITTTAAPASLAFTAPAKVTAAGLSPHAGALSHALQRLVQWCLGHPRDISAWTCLAWLVQTADAELVAQHHHCYSNSYANSYANPYSEPGAEPELEACIFRATDAARRFQDRLQWQGDSLRVFWTLTRR